MICIKCRKDIPEGSAFCNHCGASQKATQRPHKQRGNGQGSVYKRGDKWAAEVTLGYYLDASGKRKRKVRRKCGFEKKKDALAFLETLRSEAVPTQASTVADLYAIYHAEAERKLSHSKLQAYEIAWKKISGLVGFRKITALTVPELQQVTDAAGSSYYTKRDIKNLLSHLYAIAIRDDMTDKNRAQYIQLPQHETAERTIFSEDEIALLWSHSDQYIVQHILVMIYTGMRPAEILGLKVENIQLSEHYMTGGVKSRKSKARKLSNPWITRGAASQRKYHDHLRFIANRTLLRSRTFILIARVLMHGHRVWVQRLSGITRPQIKSSLYAAIQFSRCFDFRTVKYDA